MSIHTYHPASTLNSLVNLRWISLTGQILVLLGLVYGLQVELPVVLITPALLILLGANWIAHQHLLQSTQVTDTQLVGHLSTDFFALSWVFYCTGGASNPFASLLLLPLTMAAIALPSRWLWVITPFAIIAYTTLVFINIPLPPPHGSLQALDQVLAETCGIGGLHGAEDSPGSGFALHVVGMWVNFAISASIVYFFLGRQSVTLRQHEQTLQTVRERSLREERVLAIGLMAAVAAHKLGTPLSTLAVMLGELEADSPVESEDVFLMRQQIAQCKAILAEMVDNATPHNRQVLNITNWVNEWVDEWHLLRPNVLRPKINLRWKTLQPEKPEPLICPDRTLNQAIQGLLDNAADAVAGIHTQNSGENSRINIEIDWAPDNPDILQIDILDCGTGIPSNIADLLGMHFVTTKKDHNDSGEHQVGGLGIGFFLTNATIERFDGKVELFQRKPQGTLMRVRLPLNRL
jgi:two-component system sensor histidine kinase RegB